MHNLLNSMDEINKIVGQRIRFYRERLGISQPELAKRCGWKKLGARICNYELGSRQLKIQDLIIISNALEIPLVCLLSEEDPKKTLTQFYAQKIPMLDWKQAIKGENAVDELELDAHQVSIAKKCSNKSYALRIKGDAMFAQSPEVKSFLPGEIIITDPLAKPEHGKNVIAALPNATEAICRRYIVEGGNPYLTSINPSWERINVTPDTRICGVVIAKIDYEI